MCLVGPTAVGKSAVVVALAERVGAEIVCADSRQVYRTMEIGTAKPTPAERARVPHHMIDLVDPDEAYSAGRYARDASACLEALRARGARPLVVGGTGLYLRALLWGLCDGPPADAALRAAWLAREREEPGAVYRRLSEVDPASAALIHPNDLPKALRAVEVFELTGAPLSVRQRAHGFRAPRYDAVVIGLRRERDDLYARIDARVDAMIARGLAAEVEGLTRAGYGEDAPGMRAVGYRQLVGALRGAYDQDEAIRLIKRDSRRYAKRQMTWFGADPSIHWVDAGAGASVEELVDRAAAWLDHAACAAQDRRG
ncbi:MAG: tRNA (adenosine(37)-N6)-dimethylallyltransferase MiaA [Nitrospirota bacterium]